ncbi:ThiF family adenylyltransferase [Spiroplasma endosymbiont of Atherix ibis]|uniref:ThiF family adenylyltransferase n=1 Tax=Spiroplasma endosymbiont of Atherix ibis TaxID=3066291 RepID=UPI0030CE9133
MDKIIFLIGVGGTGGLLARKLAKFLSNNDNLVLIDGDKVEYKNVVRQPFQTHDVYNYKAESLAKKINSISRFKNCYSINKFLNKENSLFKIIKSFNNTFNKVIIISCVDNHKTRILIEKSTDMFKDWLSEKDFSWIGYSRTSDVIYIDSANEDIYGDILINEFRSNIYNLKIEKETELKISEESCEELINDGVVQQFATNDQASNLILKLKKLKEVLKMEKHQISTFINNLKIIKDCNVERIYFLKKHIINKIYLLAWQRDKLIENIVVYNEVLRFNRDRFHLYETILLNINQNLSEPNFIFQKNINKLFVTTKYLTKIAKYQK